MDDAFIEFKAAIEQLEKTDEPGPSTIEIKHNLNRLKKRLLHSLTTAQTDELNEETVVEQLKLSTIDLNQDKRISQESMLLEHIVDNAVNRDSICVHNQIKLAISAVNLQLSKVANLNDDLPLARKLLEESWLQVVNDVNKVSPNDGCDCLSLGLHTSTQVLVQFHQINEIVYLRLASLSALIELKQNLMDERDYFYELCSVANLVYNRWKDTMVVPYDLEQMFVPEKKIETVEDLVKIKRKVESLFNQISECEMNVSCDDGRDQRAAQICLQLLKRWLHVQDASKLKVAVHLANLSQYFSGKKNFAMAAHLIKSAFYVLDQFKNDNTSADEQDLQQSEASIRLIAVKYSIRLLEFSQENQSIDVSNTFQDDDQFQECSLFSNEQLANSNELYGIQKLFSNVIFTFEQARDLFKIGNSFINYCERFYSLDERCSDYVELEQDRATLYSLLAKYETDLGRKCKMLKKRVDLLEKVLNELNPIHYLNHVRKLNFELGEAYFDLLQIKEKQKQSNPSETATKLNRLCSKVIEKMHSFVQSFYEANTKRLPSRLDDSVVSSVMTAYSMIGKLHERMHSDDHQQNVNNIQTLLCAMQQVLDYAQRNPDQADLIQQNVITAENYKELFTRSLQKLAQ